MSLEADRSHGCGVRLKACLVAVVLATALSVAADIGPLGPQFQVGFDPVYPSGCVTHTGSVAWNPVSSRIFFVYGCGGSLPEAQLGVWLRAFDLTGSPVGVPLRLSPSPLWGTNASPSLAVALDGKIFAAWPTEFNTVEGWGSIHGQRLDANGNKLGTEFAISVEDDIDDEESRVVALPSGRWAVVWTEHPALGLRIYDSSGNPVTGVVNPLQANCIPDLADIAAGSDNKILVAWDCTSVTGGHPGFGVWGRWFDAEGVPLTNESLLNSTGGQIVVAIAPDKRWVAVWWDYAVRTWQFQRFGSDNVPIGTPTQVGPDTWEDHFTLPALTFLTGTNWIVGYPGRVPEFEAATPERLIGRVFDMNGNQQGPPIIPSRHDIEEGVTHPAIARIDDQRFVTAFSTTVIGTFGSPLTVWGRLFGPANNPVILQQPQDVANCSGSPVSFSVQASGTILSYQWEESGAVITDGPDFSGTQTPTLTILHPSVFNDQEYYSVIVTEGPPGVGETYSAFAKLTVQGDPPVATVSGTPTVCQGQGADIQVSITGQGPWDLTWSDGYQQLGVASSPATRTVTPAGTTVYSLTAVSNAGCSGTVSGSATVTVNLLPSAAVSGGGSLCAGGTANIQADLTGTGPWNVTWSDGFVQATGSTPAVRTVSPAWPTTYTVTSVTDANCAGTASGQAIVTYGATAAVSGGGTICLGSGSQIQANLTGTSPFTVQWSDGTTQSGIMSTTVARTVTPVSTTTYTVTAFSDSICAGVTQGSATVTVNYPPTPASVGGPQSICARTQTNPLGGNTPASGVGTWSVVSGGTGSFLPGPETPNARFLHSSGSGPVVLRWTITSAGCAGSSAADVQVTILPAPSGSINAASGLCSGASGLKASVLAGPGFTYYWSIQNGTITAGQSTSEITFNSGQSGATTLEVTVSNGTCFVTGSKVIPIGNPPATPVALSPANGVSGHSENWLRWQGDSGSTYSVRFDTANPPQKILVTGSGIDSVAVPVFFPETTYYWQVRATNSCSWVDSPVFSFRTGACIWTATPPHTLAPALGTTGVSRSATLSWTPTAGASHYDIYLSGAPISAATPAYRAVGADSTSLTVSLSPGTKYYWMVKSVPGCGSGAAVASLESWFEVAASGFTLTEVSPLQHDRWSQTSLAATGAGLGEGMSLITRLGDRSGGQFTVTAISPTTITGTLGADTLAPSGWYDVGLTLWGSEVARIPGSLAVRAFRDVNPPDFYFLSSSRMADAGIMEADLTPADGVPDFVPATPITRAMMAEYLARAYEWWRTGSPALATATCTPAGSGSTDFPDVPCSHPQWAAIHWIKVWGVTSGAPCAEGLCFLPSSPLTRGEMVTFLERLRYGPILGALLTTTGLVDPGCGSPWPACSGWQDAELQTEGWPRREVNVAFADRMTTGCSGSPGNGLTMCVMNSLTRGEVAEFVARAIGLVSTP